MKPGRRSCADVVTVALPTLMMPRFCVVADSTTNSLRPSPSTSAKCHTLALVRHGGAPLSDVLRYEIDCWLGVHSNTMVTIADCSTATTTTAEARPSPFTSPMNTRSTVYGALTSTPHA